MRRFSVAVALLSGLAACHSGDVTDPSGATIQVRLVDDRAATGGRNQVLVTPASGAPIDARTADDGTAAIRLSGPGTYRVQVIARAGFISSEALSRTVTVEAGKTTVLEFVLYRQGAPGYPPQDPPGY